VTDVFLPPLLLNGTVPFFGREVRRFQRWVGSFICQSQFPFSCERRPPSDLLGSVRFLTLAPHAGIPGEVVSLNLSSLWFLFPYVSTATFFLPQLVHVFLFSSPLLRRFVGGARPPFPRGSLSFSSLSTLCPPFFFRPH